VASRVVSGCTFLYVASLVLGIFGRLHRLEAGILLGLGTILFCLDLSDLLKGANATIATVRTWKKSERMLLAGVGILVIIQIFPVSRR